MTAPTPEAWTRTGRLSDPALASTLGVGAALISAIGVGIPSIWADEGATLSATQRSWSELWHLLHNIDAVHGTYYAFMKMWLDTVGPNVYTLRIPSLVAAGTLVAVTFILCREWFDRGGAVVAATLCALLPRTTWMAIEGRSWAFAAALATLGTLLVVRWAGRGGIPLLVAYGAVTALGIAVDIYLVFLVLAHGVSLLVARVGSRKLIAWSVAAFGAVAATSPVVLTASGQRGQLGDRAVLSLVDWISGVFVKQFALGDTPGDGPSLVPRSLWSGASLALAAIGWLLLAWGVWRQRTTLRTGPTIWILPWIAIPPILIGLAGLTGLNLYHPRYFSFAVGAFAIGVGQGLQALPKKSIIATMSAALMVLSLAVFVSQRETYAKNGYDWSIVAQQVATMRKQGTAAQGIYYSSSPPTRTIGDSFPGDFVGLRDITVSETPQDEGSFDGSDVPLTISTLTGAPNRVIGLWSVRSENKDLDLALFESAGYSIALRWDGPQTIVILFAR